MPTHQSVLRHITVRSKSGLTKVVYSFYKHQCIVVTYERDDHHREEWSKVHSKRISADVATIEVRAHLAGGWEQTL